MSCQIRYLQTIVANKSQFIGQLFSVLVDNLKVQIKFFSPISGLHHDMSKETATSFSFYFPQPTEDHYLTYPRLRISWSPYLNTLQSDGLFENVEGLWTIAAYNFYKNAIIADIKVRE